MPLTQVRQCSLFLAIELCFIIDRRFISHSHLFTFICSHDSLFTFWMRASGAFVNCCQLASRKVPWDNKATINRCLECITVTLFDGFLFLSMTPLTESREKKTVEEKLAILIKLKKNRKRGNVTRKCKKKRRTAWSKVVEKSWARTR
jgi:hypothetical protein